MHGTAEVRKIREVLRLRREQKLSARQIARSMGVARSTVVQCLARATQVAVPWPLPEGWDEADLHRLLYGRAKQEAPEVPLPDWSAVAEALQAKGMTRLQLWQMYKVEQPSGLQYSAFCQQFRQYRRGQTSVLRRMHVGGEKVFIDFAGPTVTWTDPRTGEAQTAYLFVAVLGASNYTYVEATVSQRAEHWLAAQARALTFFGGVPKALVPDNLKAAVLKAHRYEPQLHPSYQEFAEHYGVAVLPARVRKPRDKAKVEGAVLIVERWMLMRLRREQFLSLAALNARIGELVSELNQRPFKKLPGCRASRFEAIDRPALSALPVVPYDFGHWQKQRVAPDYHVAVQRHYYSVPSTLIGRVVEVRVSERHVEVYHRCRRIALHLRSHHEGEMTTVAEHLPAHHRAVVDMDAGRLRRRAEQIGAATAAALTVLLGGRRHPEQLQRSALGILRLAQDYTAPALEAACARALLLSSVSYRTIKLLIELPLPEPMAPVVPVLHDNVRGAAYFAPAVQEVASC